MNKRSLKLLTAALAAAVTVGYPAGAWFAGKQMEARLGEEYRQLHDFAPFVTVSSRNYERGVFSATETVTLSAELPSVQTPLQFTVASRIRHLPFPGLFALQAATIDSDIKLEGAAAAAVAEFTGGKNPAAIHSVAYFNGAGSATITVPAMNSAKLQSDEATMTIDFAKDLATYSIHGSAPRFAILEESGARVQITGVSANGDHKRIPEVGSLYTGTDHFGIDQIEVSGPKLPSGAGVIKQLAVDAVTTASGDGQFVDFAEKFGAGSVTIMGTDYGPARFDLSLNHLHARSIASLSDAGWSAGDKGPEAELKEEKEIETLFLQNPEFRVDRLSFNRPDGETVVSALFKLHDAQPGDAMNPAAWAGKAYASVDVKMPEKLLSDLSQNMVGAVLLQGVGLSGDAAVGMVAGMVAGGYITREEGFLKTKFEFHDAKPWLNGKELVPPAAKPHARARLPHRRGR